MKRIILMLTVEAMMAAMVALSPGVASAQERPDLPPLCFPQQGDLPVVWCPLDDVFNSLADVINLVDFGGQTRDVNVDD